jgi:predicted ATPase
VSEERAARLKANEIAKAQGSRSLKLIAAMSLAKLRVALGRRMEARDHLAAVYGSFNKGFDPADLHAAQRLLDSLS